MHPQPPLAMGTPAVCMGSHPESYRRNVTFCITHACTRPMAARAASQKHSPHMCECFGHLFASQLQRTAERTGTQKFPQEQVSSDVRRRTRWATSLVARARPHDPGSGPCMPRKSSAGRARPPSLEHPSISSTLTVGDDIIADGVSLLNVVRMLGPGEPVRTEC